MAMRDVIKSTIVNYGGQVSVFVGTPTTNSYGEESLSYGSAASEYCVPYNYFSNLGVWGEYGRLNEGEAIVIFPYDSTIAGDGKVTMFSTDYDVESVEDFSFQGVIVGKQVVLKKQNL